MPDNNAPAMPQPTKIFAFTAPGTRAAVHLYDDPAQLVADIGAWPPDSPVEFFDCHGRRLAPVFGAGWTLTDIRFAAGRPSESTVLKRLRTTLKRASAAYPAEAAAHPILAAARGRRAVPGVLTDDLSLEKAYDELKGEGFAHDAFPNPIDLGSAWHNFWSHGIIG